jgi:streptogramin lyase
MDAHDEMRYARAVARNRLNLVLASVALIAASCAAADDAGGSEGGGLGGSGDTTGTPGDGDGDGDGDGAGDGDGDGDGTGDGDGDGDGDGPKFDLQPWDDSGEGGEPELGFSYIWIANTHEGTVSKIDTRTLVEEGRYVTRPDGAGSPSRTSVNLAGDVAVLNRSGGVAKILADPEECQDTNGTPGIQTATDASFLPWGTEECVEWFVDMDYSSQRALAWTSDGNLWVTGYHEGSTTVDVLLLDGSSGVTMDSTTVAVPAIAGFWSTKQSYGGAVDGNDDFWWTDALPEDQGHMELVRVRYDDLEVDTWDKPYNTYGMTVDPQGRPWACGGYGERLLRFDPDTETWDTTDFSDAPVAAVVAHTGCMADGEGRLWFAAELAGEGTAVAAIDTETLEALQVFELPDENDLPRGISIDVDGYVWGVSFAFSLADVADGKGQNAYRYEADTGDYEVFSELSGAYTYSDMTGAALRGVQPEG